MKKFSDKDMEAQILSLPREIQQYKDAGDFKRALLAVEEWQKKTLSNQMKSRLGYEKFLLERLPDQFPYTKESVIRLFKEKIPDFSAKDLEMLEKKNLAEWIFIDGEKHYIHNLLRNALDEDNSLKVRAGLDTGQSEDRREVGRVIAFMRKNGSADARFRVRASVGLKDEVFEEGIKIRAHLPIPAELFQISDVKLLNYTKSSKVTVDEPESLWRSICFEETMKENHPFEADYEYSVHMNYADLWKNLKETEALTEKEQKEMKEFLSPKLPHIYFSPEIKALAEELFGGEPDPLEIARRSYDYITKNITYSYMKDYALIPDISRYCAENLRGDCGVQALLFITLLRIGGVPARWQSGLYTHPHYTGPHDWAMFFVKPYGWLYADPSFGGEAYARGSEEDRQFYFGNIDPFRMAANNAFMKGFAAEKEFQPADPCDNQTGEMESQSRGYTDAEMEKTKTCLSFTSFF